MLHNVLDVVDIEKKLTGKEVRVGAFDLILNGQRRQFLDNSIMQTYLACYEPDISCSYSDPYQKTITIELEKKESTPKQKSWK